MTAPNSTIKFSALLLLCLLCSPAIAAGGESAAAVISSLYDGFKDPIVEFGASMSSHGAKLIVALMICHVVVGAISYGAGSKDMFELFIDGLKLSFVGSLLYAFVVPQPWLQNMVGGGYSGTGVEMLIGGLRSLFASVGLSSTAGGAIGVMANSIFEAIFKLTELEIVPDEMGWMEVISNIIPMLISLVWVCLACVSLLVAGALVLGEALGADLMLVFATAIAPLVIPWVLFKPLSFLFSGWLRAVIIAGVGLLIAGLFVKGMQAFSAAAVASVADIPSGFFSSWSTSITHFAPIFIGSLITILLAGKISGMAGSLISGGGFDGISIMAMRQGVGGLQTAGNAAGSVGKGAWNTGKAVGKGALNAVPAAKGAQLGVRTALANNTSRMRGATEGVAAGVKARADRRADAAELKNVRVQGMADQLNGKQPSTTKPATSASGG